MHKDEFNILEVEGLSKYFPVKKGFWGKVSGKIQAVSHVSFEVKNREILGLVGESGCGKSTLGRTILKLIEPDEGSVTFDGTDITCFSQKEMRPLRRELQIIFQDPYASLNPRMTVGSAIAEPLLVHGLVKKRHRRDRVVELLEMVGLGAGEYSKYPHEFSGGQRQRVGIARALAVKPRLVIADEPVSALDVSIQAQIINLLSDLKTRLGLAMIFIAHDLKVVEHISNRIIVMYLGKIMEVTNSDNLQNAKHPYTRSLLSAIPVPDPLVKRERIILKGDVPSPMDPPSGCVFRTRCPLAQEICRTAVPQLRSLAPGHMAACHLVVP